jgi:hypothetical protein
MVSPKIRWMAGESISDRHHFFPVAASARKRRRATRLPDDSTTKLLRAEATHTGATMMRHGFDLVLTAMLIAGICSLLSLSRTLVRTTGTTDKGGRVTADVTLADMKGMVP